MIIIDNLELLKEIINDQDFPSERFEIGYSYNKSKEIYHKCHIYIYKLDVYCTIGIRGNFNDILGYIYSDSLLEEYKKRKDYDIYNNSIYVKKNIDIYKEERELFKNNLHANLAHIHKYTNREASSVLMSYDLRESLSLSYKIHLFNVDTSIGCTDNKIFYINDNLSYCKPFFSNIQRNNKDFNFLVKLNKNLNEWYVINMLNDEPGVIKNLDI